jgi:hypothetical protein
VNPASGKVLDPLPELPAVQEPPPGPLAEVSSDDLRASLRAIEKERDGERVGNRCELPSAERSQELRLQESAVRAELQRRSR